MSVVDVDVVPTEGLPGHLPRHIALCQQRRGSTFSTYMDRRCRDMVVDFIVNKSKRIPIRAALVQLDHVRSDFGYPTILDGIQKVGFIREDIFLLFNRNDLKPEVIKELGETIYSGEQILKILYS